MSTSTAAENQARIEKLYQALTEGDMETILGTLDEDVVWTEAAGFPTSTEEGVFRGPDEVLDGVFAFLGSEFEGFAADPERFVADEDTVVTIGNYRGANPETGESFDTRFVHVWELAGDKVVRFEQIADTAPVQDVMS
jgi:ketosteroid isomerase-like protein